MIPVMTIDGPTASGKGTISRKIASQLGWNLLDSGALYRVVAWVALEKNVPLDSAARLAKIAGQCMAKFHPKDVLQTRVYFENQDITDLVRTERVSQAASQIAQYQAVREALLATQRAFLQPPGLVADGRDMGTVVFPKANIKIYLTASVEERAKRRLNQLKGKGLNVMLGDLVCEVRRRDARDTDRLVAPLVPASDARVVDTTNCTIDEVVESILQMWACSIN